MAKSTMVIPSQKRKRLQRRSILQENVPCKYVLVKPNVLQQNVPCKYVLVNRMSYNRIFDTNTEFFIFHTLYTFSQKFHTQSNIGNQIEKLFYVKFWKHHIMHYLSSIFNPSKIFYINITEEQMICLHVKYNLTRGPRALMVT